MCCFLTFTLVVATQMAVIAPSIPIFQSVFQFSAMAVGLLTGVWALARTTVSLPAAKMASVAGTRTSLVLGVLLSFTGWILISLPHSYWSVLMGQFVLGLGGGIVTSIGPLILSEWFPKEQIGIALGIWTTAMDTGLIWEIPLAAWIMSNWGWRYAYALFGTLSLTIVIPAFFVLNCPSPYPLHKSQGGELRATSLLRKTPYLLASLAIFLGMGYIAVISTYIVKWGMIKGYDYVLSSYLGTLISVGAMISKISSGYVSDRILGGKRRPLFMLGALISFVSTILYAVVDGGPLIMAITAFMGVGVGLIVTASFSIPLSFVSLKERGLAMGITGVFIYGSYVSTPLIGHLFDVYGLYVACIATSLLTLSALLIMLTVKGHV
ncbi:MAG: MFS transporter [Desulfurococcaceae archaeon]